MGSLIIETVNRKQIVDLTDRVNALLKGQYVERGLCSLFLLHTTAALTTGEVGEGTDLDLLDVVEAHNPSHEIQARARPHACLVTYGILDFRTIIISPGGERGGPARDVAVYFTRGAGWT